MILSMIIIINLKLGICDSDESDTNFNEHIKDTTLIIQTSDVNKAFITTRKVNENNQIFDILKIIIKIQQLKLFKKNQSFE